MEARARKATLGASLPRTIASWGSEGRYWTERKPYNRRLYHQTRALGFVAKGGVGEEKGGHGTREKWPGRDAYIYPHYKRHGKRKETGEKKSGQHQETARSCDELSSSKTGGIVPAALEIPRQLQSVKLWAAGCSDPCIETPVRYRQGPRLPLPKSPCDNVGTWLAPLAPKLAHFLCSVSFFGLRDSPLSHSLSNFVIRPGPRGR